MESWHKPSVRGGEDYRGCKMVRDRNRDRDSPSFSSTLLDAIYRSIDQGEDEQQQQQGLVLYRETMGRKNKMHHHHQGGDQDDDDDGMASLRRAIMIEKWMEKKVVVWRKSGADTRRREHPLVHSSSSSSESSCGGSGFSSSETESTSFRPPNSRSLHLKSAQKPVVRTTVSKACGGESLVLDRRDAPILHPHPHHHPQKAKHESGFAKTKSKALKIYGDLKRAKQPISPGAKLSSFINSLFTAGNAKNPIHSNSERKSKPASTRTSASSFSRSCLSKSPSAVGKRRGGGVGSSAGAVKRSVRFVVDEEGSRACGHKNRTADTKTFTDSWKGGGYAKFQVRVEEEAAAVRDLRKTFGDGGDESDDGDGASCASSDLFELDNLSSIGIGIGIGIGLDGRYREELPVYETTHIAPLPID